MLHRGRLHHRFRHGIFLELSGITVEVDGLSEIAGPLARFFFNKRRKTSALIQRCVRAIVSFSWIVVIVTARGRRSMTIMAKIICILALILELLVGIMRVAWGLLSDVPLSRCMLYAGRVWKPNSGHEVGNGGVARTVDRHDQRR